MAHQYIDFDSPATGNKLKTKKTSEYNAIKCKLPEY